MLTPINTKLVYDFTQTKEPHLVVGRLKKQKAEKDKNTDHKP